MLVSIDTVSKFSDNTTSVGPASKPGKTDELMVRVTVDFSGGLEFLFGNVKHFDLDFNKCTQSIAKTNDAAHELKSSQTTNANTTSTTTTTSSEENKTHTRTKEQNATKENAADEAKANAKDKQAKPSTHDTTTTTTNNNTTVPLRDVLVHLRDTHLKERPELFMQGSSVRPGILVLINDVDWELEGGIDYHCQDGDELVLISTLHGG